MVRFVPPRLAPLVTLALQARVRQDGVAPASVALPAQPPLPAVAGLPQAGGGDNDDDAFLALLFEKITAKNDGGFKQRVLASKAIVEKWAAMDMQEKAPYFKIAKSGFSDEREVDRLASYASADGSGDVKLSDGEDADFSAYLLFLYNELQSSTQTIKAFVMASEKWGAMDDSAKAAFIAEAGKAEDA